MANNETSITVKAVVIIGIFCAIAGAGFGMLVNHEMRISRVEASITSLKNNSNITQRMVMAIREDQVAFYRSQNPKWESSFDARTGIFKNEEGNE